MTEFFRSKFTWTKYVLVEILCDLYLECFAQVHDAGHVDFVESGEHGAGVLGFLETLGDSDAHSIHFHASLASISTTAHGRRCWNRLQAK